MKTSQESIVKKTKHRVIYSCILASVSFLRLFPRRAALSIMRGMGWAAFYLMISARHRTFRHLTMAFGQEKPPSEIHRMAKQVFSNLGAFVADVILMRRLIRRGTQQLITAEGREHLDSLSRNNEAAILLTAHFGNWELLAAWVAQSGYRIKVLVAPQTNPWINRLIADMRKGAGYQSIERGNQTREALRALAGGYSIGALIDADTKVDGVFVKFFNQWAYTPAGPVRLALKYGLKIIPVFMYRRSDDTYHVEVKAPLPLVVTGDKRRDVIMNTQKCTDAYEAIIREHPEQWLWMMRRWKTQPKGETLEACERDSRAAVSSVEP